MPMIAEETVPLEVRMKLSKGMVNAEVANYYKPFGVNDCIE